MSHPMSALQAFTYNAQPVRIVEMNGQPWFVLKDVCNVLGILQPTRVAERLDDDEKGVTQIHTPGGKQDLLTVSESGLYAVILRSDKPEAKPFRKWVTAEVLPSIRKHGFYETPGNLKPRRNRSQAKAEKYVYTSIRCKVCASEHAHRIDQMLMGNILTQKGQRFQYEDILFWARLQGLELSKAGLSRHRTEHLLPRIQAEQKPARNTLDGLLRDMVREELKGALKDVLSTVQHEVRAQTAKVMLPDVVTLEQEPDDMTTEEHVPTPQKQPSKARPKAKRGKGQRVMPRTLQDALKLEQEFIKVQIKPSGMRGPLLNQIAKDYGAHPSTVYRWFAQYEKDGVGGLMRLPRADKGHGRLPTDQVRKILDFVEAWPHHSSRAIYRLLKETRPELLAYTGAQGQERTVSEDSVRKMVQQVRNPVGE